jgi:hypothetical protein
MNFLFPLAFLLFFLPGCKDPGHEPGKEDKNADTANRGKAAAPQNSNLHWVDTLKIVDKNDTCGMKVLAQLKMLREETSDQEFTFEKFAVSHEEVANPAPIDLRTSRSAREFKTKLTESVTAAGINFAGHYTIGEVGMTGWGRNYWIVDRRNGRTYEFPFKPHHLDFRPDSRLVIMDSKESIMNEMRSTEDWRFMCAYRNLGTPSFYYDLFPVYLEWKNNEWKVLAPKNSTPLKNVFWKEYFR